MPVGIAYAQMQPGSSRQQPETMSAEQAEYIRNERLIVRLNLSITKRNASIKRLIDEIVALKKALATRGRFFPPEDFDPPLFPPGAELKRAIEVQRQEIQLLGLTLQRRMAIERGLRHRRDEIRQELRRADQDARARK